MDKIAAIPTKYAGVNFRSRLEARWAAFFDLLGWKWDYEPLDMSGWIPDFVVHGERPIFVEVKPVFEFPDEVGKKVVTCLQLGTGLVNFSPSGGGASAVENTLEAIVCGASLLSAECASPNYGLGWLWDGHWACAPLFRVPEGPEKGEWGFCHQEQSYRDRVTGWHDGWWPGDMNGEADKLWREAGNKVQWRSRWRARKKGDQYVQ